MVSFSIGPLAVSTARLLVVMGFALALLVGWLVGRRSGRRVDSLLTGMAISGLLGARFAFVVVYLDDYLASPLSIIDIRDGGFYPLAGLVFALLWAIPHVWRDRALLKPLTAASFSGVAAWALGMSLFSVAPEEHPPLPPISLTTMDGSSINLLDFRGKPMVVNLWATWCIPCRREMPVLAEAQQREQDVHFIFLNQAESPDAIEEYLLDEDLDLANILLDSAAVSSRLLLTRGLPATYFFDADGTPVEYHIGELSRATLSHKLRSLR